MAIYRNLVGLRAGVPTRREGLRDLLKFAPQYGAYVAEAKSALHIFLATLGRLSAFYCSHERLSS